MSFVRCIFENVYLVVFLTGFLIKWLNHRIPLIEISGILEHVFSRRIFPGKSPTITVTSCFRSEWSTMEWYVKKSQRVLKRFENISLYPNI